jgi:predicted secreted hydrolase
MILCITAGLTGCGSKTSEPSRTSLNLGSASGADPGFARITQPIPLSFPADYGAHEAYQTEWWYTTGNLDAQDGAHYGFELTFFRRGLIPQAEQEARTSNWAANQVYLAHFTLTDVNGSRFEASEKLARGAAGLAGATADPAFDLHLESWEIRQTGENEFHLSAGQEDQAANLTLSMEKAPVLQGDQGYSEKGPETGNASCYFSLTRLKTAGTLTIDGRIIPVSGWSWMDHEFSTSALAKDQRGWDWFALQTDDHQEIMVYTLRKTDGSTDPYSRGTLVGPDGETLHLDAADFTITPLDTWKSPHSRAVYPARWKISIPTQAVDLEVQPYLADQELNLSFIYWEGAVKFSGTMGGKPVNGSGYVELTGYAQSMQGQF